MREFFGKCGFRLSHRFMMMKYMHPVGEGGIAPFGEGGGPEGGAMLTLPQPTLHQIALRPSIHALLADCEKLVTPVQQEEEPEVDVDVSPLVSSAELHVVPATAAEDDEACDELASV